MSDVIDELFKRFEKRLKDIESEMIREVQRISREIERTFTSIRKPWYSYEVSGIHGETIEPLYTIRDLGDRIVIYLDLPYSATGSLDIKFSGNIMYISAKLKSKINLENWSSRYRGIEVSEYKTAITLPFTPDPNNVKIRAKKGVVEIVIFK